MHAAEFHATAPGQVIHSTLGHLTFVPDLLPPELGYSDELERTFAEANQALGELRGVGRMLPNPHLLIDPFVRREAVLSSRIEGTVTQLGQLFLFEADPARQSHEDDLEVANYVRAAEHGLTAVRSGMPIGRQLLCEIHRILLTGVRGADKRPGQLRDRAVLIGRATDTFDSARFVPPCHTRVEQLLHDLVSYLRSGPSAPVLVQLALAHYQFETVHPFNDGNGRVGRLLITLMLAERGVLPEPLLYLSAFFERHRQEYYDHLLSVSRRGAWTDWLLFFATGVAEQAADAVTRARRLISLREEFRRRAIQATRSPQAHLLVDALFLTPYITAAAAAAVMAVSPKSANNTLVSFVEAGLLREITGQSRNRVFLADEVFRAIDEPLAADPPPG